MERGNCKKCPYTGPEFDHYHVIVKNGVVTGVSYISGSGYWDRELTPDEYFVEYADCEEE